MNPLAKFESEVEYFVVKSVLTPLAVAFADKGITVEMMQNILKMSSALSTPRYRTKTQHVVEEEKTTSVLPEEKCVYIKRGNVPCEGKKETGKEYCKVCLNRPALKKKLEKKDDSPKLEMSDKL